MIGASRFGASLGGSSSAQRSLTQLPSGVSQVYSTPQVANGGYRTTPAATRSAVTRTVSPSPRDQASQRLTPRGGTHLTASEAISKAHTMHAEVTELENTITYQQEEIAWLKEKLLHHRRKTLEKYFTWDDNFTKQAFFHEWKHVYHHEKKMRDIDGIHAMREKDRLALVREIEGLQHSLMEVEQANSALQAQLQANQDKLSKAERLIRAVAATTNEYDMESPPVQPAEITGESQFIKGKLHELLRETDSHYIAPTRTVTVNDQTLTQIPITRTDRMAITQEMPLGMVSLPRATTTISGMPRVSLG